MGIIFGLISALTDSLKNFFGKKCSATFEPIILSWSLLVISALMLFPLIFLSKSAFPDKIFWYALVSRSFLDSFAVILFFKSIKISDLSLTLPLLSLTSIPLLIFGIIFNHEIPGFKGILGVAFMVLGIYLLNLKKEFNFFHPLLEIFKNQTSLLMFTVAMIWGVTGTLHKIAILHSDVFLYTGLGSVALALFFTLILLIVDHRKLINFLKIENFKKVMPIGFFEGISLLFQMLSQSILFSVYALALKRSSIMISSILGGVYFNEPLKKRILPIVFVLAGVIMVAV